MGALLGLGQMSQPNLSVSVYQLRIALLRTSPHIWRRVLVPGQFTLAQLHQTLRALFGWSETHPHRFLIRAKSFSGDPLDRSDGATAARLSDFQFYLRERFLYEYRYDLRVALWRHEIRVEKMLTLQEQWPHPRCIAGAGTPPPEPVASPQEFRHMQDLFTPRYILQHLAEMTDRGHDDRRIAEQVRYLRPWLTRGEFRKSEANRQLEAAAGANR
jgi:Plasmid pRiA4b ORF-3-like protein